MAGFPAVCFRIPRTFKTSREKGPQIRRNRQELKLLGDGDKTADWIKEEIEDDEFVIMTACLSIVRRWALQPYRVMNPYVSMEELMRHHRNGTDPKPPKRYMKIVEDGRR